MGAFSFAAAQKRALGRIHRKTADAVKRAMRRAGVVRWQTTVGRECSTYDGRKVPNYYLIWLQWARMIGVGVEELVFRVVTHYRAETRRDGPALGIGINALIGDKAREWAISEIASTVARVPRRPPIAETPAMYRERVMKSRRRGAASRRMWRNGPGWNGSMIRMERRDSVDAVVGVVRGAE